MDYSQKLAMSYYKNIATLNEEHNIFLVQHQDTGKIYVKKVLDVYNIDIYKELSAHPICGIPRIIEYYEYENQLFLIENYVSGQSLEEIIGAQPLDLSCILHYALGLCDILDKLHHMQPPIIHRDIKPSNIIITDSGNVALIDFNAAKFFSDSTTTDTILLGTQGYAAPEQYGFGSSTPKTDIYALGILLKEFTSSLASIPSGFTKIIEKCTKMNPSDRYGSISDLSDALLQLAPPYPDRQIPFSYKMLLPPGFRTLTAWKMLIAIPNYLLIFWLSLSLEVKDTYGLPLWVERIFCLFMFLSIVFGTCNYLNIQKHFPLCQNKYRIVRFFGVVLLDVTLAAAIFMTMVIVTSILSL